MIDSMGRQGIIYVFGAVIVALLVGVVTMWLGAINRRKAYTKLRTICKTLSLRPVSVKYVSASFVGEYRGARVVVLTQPTDGSLAPHTMIDAVFLVMDMNVYQDVAPPHIPTTLSDSLPKTMQLRGGGKYIFTGSSLDLIMRAVWGTPWPGLHVIASPGTLSAEAFRTTFDRMYQERERIQATVR